MEDKKDSRLENPGKRWCILRHADSDLIAEIFRGDRKVYNSDTNDCCPLPPFEFFIPFEDLKQKPIERKSTANDDYKPYDAMLDERALRNDLHHFIFIQISKEQVLSLLDAPWVKVLRNRLYVYKDEKGSPIEISDVEMERFKTVIKRYDFQIVNGEPSSDVHEGDEVTVVSGPMSGSEGKVVEIREREGQLLLTIEFTMFQNKMCIAVPGVNIADVRLKVQKTQQLLQDPVIGHFEDELIELLCHLHGKKGTKALNKEDRKQLKFLYQYSDIIFEDNPINRAKFAALMLICVYLMGDKKEIKRRSKQVEDLLESNKAPEAPSPTPNSKFKIQNSKLEAGAEKKSDERCQKEDERCQMEDVRGQMEDVRGQMSDSSLFTLHSKLETDSKLYTLHSKLESGSKLYTLNSTLENCSSLSEIAAYLITALFIANHDPLLRQQAKAWRKAHPDCPLAIRRFLSIAKQIRC